MIIIKLIKIFFKLLNTINMSIKYKKKFVKINIKKNEIQLLNILLKINYLKYVKKVNNNLYIIFPTLNRNFFFIKNLYKPSNLISIRKKELIKLVIKQHHLMIISTSKGLQLVSKENTCIGGVLVAKVLFN